METGVATRPRRLGRLQAQAGRLGLQIRPDHAPGVRGRRSATRRIVFAEGEDERVLRAANAMLIEETTDLPILIGRPEVIEARCERAGLPIRPGRDFEIW
jgi:malate dehydrogenase (oxaloacetate-decarboxylating)(NADP+)